MTLWALDWGWLQCELCCGSGVTPDGWECLGCWGEGGVYDYVEAWTYDPLDYWVDFVEVVTA